jgi:hypothetical protein
MQPVLEARNFEAALGYATNETTRAGVLLQRQRRRRTLGGEMIVCRVAAVIVLAGLAFGSRIPAAHALAGSEAWCIVTDEGDNKCNYATAQQCLAAVAGTRGGFCNENSSGGSSAPAPSPTRGRRGR